MKRGGYIKLYRSLADNPLWTREPFTRGQAWADLLMLANYKPGHLRVRGNRVDLGRGQVGWSSERLALRWKWSRGKVNRFLKELENDRQIVQQKSSVSTVMTITNYERYQQNGQKTVQQTDTRRTPDGTADGTADGHQNGALIKKEEVKNSKKGVRASFVKPTQEEVAAYCRERGKGVNAQLWYDHYESNGWRVGRNAMKDWKAAVRKWENSDFGNGKPAAPPAEKLWSTIRADKFAAMESKGAFTETHRSVKTPTTIRGTTKDGQRFQCIDYPLPQ
jgi:hypothetical protein